MNHRATIFSFNCLHLHCALFVHFFLSTKSSLDCQENILTVNSSAVKAGNIGSTFQLVGKNWELFRKGELCQ